MSALFVSSKAGLRLVSGKERGQERTPVTVSPMSAAFRSSGLEPIRKHAAATVRRWVGRCKAPGSGQSTDRSSTSELSAARASCQVASRRSQSQIASCKLQVARSRVIGETKRFWAGGGIGRWVRTGNQRIATRSAWLLGPNRAAGGETQSSQLIQPFGSALANSPASRVPIWV